VPPSPEQATSPRRHNKTRLRYKYIIALYIKEGDTLPPQKYRVFKQLRT
jgi:hypothetical protein